MVAGQNSSTTCDNCVIRGWLHDTNTNTTTVNSHIGAAEAMSDCQCGLLDGFQVRAWLISEFLDVYYRTKVTMINPPIMASLMGKLPLILVFVPKSRFLCPKAGFRALIPGLRPLNQGLEPKTLVKGPKAGFRAQKQG